VLRDLEIGGWHIAQVTSEWIEIAAVVIIAASVVIAGVAAIRAATRGSAAAAITAFRHQIARGLLLGLDLLIAADVIRTVTLEPTIENVAALGLLVIVRTFLTWSLVVESEGRWPWQPRRPDSGPADEG
jgi:uncharacterized membrane protein